jgi:hypothetical protein
MEDIKCVMTDTLNGFSQGLPWRYLHIIVLFNIVLQMQQQMGISFDTCNGFPLCHLMRIVFIWVKFETPLFY